MLGCYNVNCFQLYQSSSTSYYGIEQKSGLLVSWTSVDSGAHTLSQQPLE